MPHAPGDDPDGPYVVLHRVQSDTGHLSVYVRYAGRDYYLGRRYVVQWTSRRSEFDHSPGRFICFIGTGDNAYVRDTVSRHDDPD